MVDILILLSVVFKNVSCKVVKLVNFGWLQLQYILFFLLPNSSVELLLRVGLEIILGSACSLKVSMWIIK